VFASKFFTLMILLTLLALGGAVGLQVMEMQQYNLIDTLYKRYIDSGEAAAPAAPAKAPAAGKKDVKADKK
jgi:hypothetical protein